MTAHFNENSPGSECQSNTMIQRTSGRTKSKRSETSRDRWS